MIMLGRLLMGVFGSIYLIYTTIINDTTLVAHYLGYHFQAGTVDGRYFPAVRDVSDKYASSSVILKWKVFIVPRVFRYVLLNW